MMKQLDEAKTNRMVNMNRGAAVVLLLALVLGFFRAISGQETSAGKPAAVSDEAEVKTFRDVVEPYLQRHCVRCHNADKMKSGVRVDQLKPLPEDRHLPLWKEIEKQIADENMPPEDEPQPTAEERKAVLAWIPLAVNNALARNTARNGSIRRLTVPQYRNTLRDLLGLDEDLTETLPPDGVSKEGFTNHGPTLLLSPLQVEAYFDIAEKSLDLCIVDETQPPVIENFRMEFGESINAQPCPDNLVLGANNHLLRNQDFVVTELRAEKPFPIVPFAMQTKFNFIEGYVGNDTIREWRKFDSIYHAVFACMRGTPGYPKGEAFQVIPDGLVLRPAIPSMEIFGISNTYGPMANFKISLRELPDRGNFRVTVRAARYNDGLLLDNGTLAAAKNADSIEILAGAGGEALAATVARAGLYQVDVYRPAGSPKGSLQLQLGDRHFAGELYESKVAGAEPNAPSDQMASAFLLVRLPAGNAKILPRLSGNAKLARLVLNPVSEESDLGKRFLTFEKRSPSVGVHVGLRRDCGSTLTRVQDPLRVAATDLENYVFEGPINDFPSPEVEKDNVNYLAGVREIGVRSEYTDGREMPRLLIRSIEFEGPYYTQWPPESHRRIFIDSPNKENRPVYAREILRSFATRAFRRPCTDDEVEKLAGIWKEAYSEKQDFRESIKEALIAVLTSPQFLFLIENSRGPEAEDLDDFELASKLSYFLWNTAPDERLRELAVRGKLRESLDAEIERLIADRNFGRFAHEFGSQWLSLDKFDVVSIDAKKYPKLTRDAKLHLRQEPIELLRHVVQHNLPLRDLISADYIMADEVVATYYGLGSKVESGFQFVPVRHENGQLGGVLTQAGILSGLSDGRESNPVKRGAWFARKIIAEPPADPPPNVPKLPENDGSTLTLRQKLEQHRNQEGCVKCHSGIDPWGLPFEQYDAGGLFRTGSVDGRSKLPDGIEVADLNGLKEHLVRDRLDQVAFSFLKHLSVYATGRSLTYNELVFLRKESLNLKASDYRIQDLVRFVIHSDLFMKK